MSQAARRIGIEIRPAAIDDLEALLEIYCSSATYDVALDHDHYRVPDAAAARAERLREMIEDDGRSSGYLAAAVDGRIVGSVSIAILPLPPDGSMMAAVPNRRDRHRRAGRQARFGVGTALMAIRRGLGRGARNPRDPSGHVSVRNAAAQRFYERLGYEVNGLYLRKAIG